MDSRDGLGDVGLESLTKREWETLELFLEGLTMKEVAQSMAVSTSTINTYSNSIYRKLEVNSRAQLLLRCHKLIEKHSH